MDALLDALDRPLYHRRTIAFIGIVGLGCVATAILLPKLPLAAASCPSAEERLRGVWDDDRAAEVRGAFEATGLPYAMDSWIRTRERLDGHATSLAERYQEVCTQMGGEHDDPVRDFEMACLHGRREELRAMVDLLTSGDPHVVLQATQAAAELDSVDSCRREGDEASMMVGPAPKQQPTIDEIRLALARAEAALKSGAFDVGIEHAEWAFERAREIDYVPSEVEALYHLGNLQALVGQVWLRHATAALERIGPDAVLTAELHEAHGVVLRTQGRFEDALGEFRAALEQRQRAQGEDNLGHALFEAGRLDEAVQALEHAMELLRRNSGPNCGRGSSPSTRTRAPAPRRLGARAARSTSRAWPRRL